MNLLPLNPQRGYIGMAVIAFLIVLSMILYPWAPPVKTGGECIVGDVASGESIFLPPIINVGEDRGLPGGWDESKPNVEYVMIRKNVPIFMNSTDPNYALGYPDWNGRDDQAGPLKLRWPIIADTEYLGRNADIRHTLEYPNANQPGFDVYYPNETGEVELPFTTTDRVGAVGKILTLRTEGFLIFVHLDSNNQPVILNYGSHIYFVTDFYQDKNMYETPDKVKGYNVEDIFQCLDPDAPASPTVKDPKQDKSRTRDQLQLEWFLFEGEPGMYSHCKPAVYLYPTKKQLVNVKVFPKGELSYTDPPYDNKKGWIVWAEPSGAIYEIRDTRYEIRYPYLYYESKLLDSEIKKPSQGWVVKTESGSMNHESWNGPLKKLFEQVLPELGLNQKETTDFSEYWLKTLPESKYYFVGLVDRQQRDYLEPLEVTPKPDTSIRFSLYFEPLDSPKIVEEPEIITPQRAGFTLVDWGGMIKLNKNTPFTCSQ